MELPAVNSLSTVQLNQKHDLPATSKSRLVILTSGTTGAAKAIVQRASLLNFISPLSAVLTRLKIGKYKSAYIATPMYHGAGLAYLYLLIALGKNIIITRYFEAGKACALVREHKIEVIALVPLMLQRMLKSPEDLGSLACIASGSAELNPGLVKATFAKLGDVLYNLYGTSEAGLNIIATTKDLKYSPKTLGKKIPGASLKILDEKDAEVKPGSIGRICISNKWSMINKEQSWVETGDLGYRDAEGYYFLCGRADDMIVSGGENVHPLEVEQILLGHPQVEDAAVIGVRDEDFGQRLRAFILPERGARISEAELWAWIRSQVARYQVPREIVIVDKLPYTAVGKLNRKALKAQYPGSRLGEDLQIKVRR